MLQWTAEGDHLVLEDTEVDVPGLETQMVASIADLLPGAKLVQHQDGADYPLACLPMDLVPAPAAVVSAAGDPVRLALGAAWACLAMTVLGGAYLLASALALAARRAAFVSAVSHELRTPITSLRLYTDLLISGAAGDEAGRSACIATLASESARLADLVENVLANYGLDHVRRPALESISLQALAQASRERLTRRAEAAGMSLAIDLAEAASLPVRCQATTIDRILFNLVDNACKYGRREDGGGCIRISAITASGRIGLRVQDEGPGVDAQARRRLFRPFSRSAAEAAASSPGVGLGLALSRRLARSLSGELELEQGGGPGGAAFVLWLVPG